MRAQIIAILLPLSAVAGKWDVVVPGANPFPDPESSTNVSFNVARSDVRHFGVTLELSGSTSNCVDVAFGRDANGDGMLAPEEADLVLGWTGGVYTLEDVASDARYVEPAVNCESSRRIAFSVATDKNFVPIRAGVTNETGACFAEIADAAPRWLFRPEWNLMKVTRRGLVLGDGWCRVECDYNHFGVMVR